MSFKISDVKTWVIAHKDLATMQISPRYLIEILDRYEKICDAMKDQSTHWKNRGHTHEEKTCHVCQALAHHGPEVPL